MLVAKQSNSHTHTALNLDSSTQTSLLRSAKCPSERTLYKYRNAGIYMVGNVATTRPRNLINRPRTHMRIHANVRNALPHKDIQRIIRKHQRCQRRRSKTNQHAYADKFQKCVHTRIGYTRDTPKASKMPRVEKTHKPSTRELYNRCTNSSTRHTMISRAFLYTGCLATRATAMSECCQTDCLHAHVGEVK